jgi:hypothetical protein
VIKFRQGVGRLIRTQADRGVITVLDSRVLAKSYGRLFMEGLPSAPSSGSPGRTGRSNFVLSPDGLPGLSSQPLMTILRAACFSDIGKVRKENEDRSSSTRTTQLFGVADGVGGLPGGGRGGPGGGRLVTAAVLEAGRTPSWT